jgi:uncharacterized protein (TIGR02246 family)
LLRLIAVERRAAMKSFRSSTPLALLASVLACTQTESQRDLSVEEAEVAVQEMLVKQDSAANAADLDGFLSLVRDDAVFLPPGEAPLDGKEAIRTWYTNLFDNFVVEIVHHPGPVEPVGSLVIHRGSASGTLTPRAGGDPTSFDNKYLFVLRREPDGSLRHWRVMFNANAGQAEQ